MIQCASKAVRATCVALSFHGQPQKPGGGGGNGDWYVRVRRGAQVRARVCTCTCAPVHVCVFVCRSVATSLLHSGDCAPPAPYGDGWSVTCVGVADTVSTTGHTCTPQEREKGLSRDECSTVDAFCKQVCNDGIRTSMRTEHLQCGRGLPRGGGVGVIVLEALCI